MYERNSLPSVHYSIGHFRHVTLVITALLLIVSNDYVRSETVKDLKTSCMRNPLQPDCRGSVMKRGVPKMQTLDMIFDHYLRSKLFRTPITMVDNRHNKWNTLSKLTKRDRSNINNYQPSEAEQTNRNNLKLWERLYRNEPTDGMEIDRYSRNTDLRHVNDNNPDNLVPAFLDNEYK